MFSIASIVRLPEIVPHPTTHLENTLVPTLSFPHAAWECSPGRSASSELSAEATQRVERRHSHAERGNKAPRHPRSSLDISGGAHAAGTFRATASSPIVTGAPSSIAISATKCKAPGDSRSFARKKQGPGKNFGKSRGRARADSEFAHQRHGPHCRFHVVKAKMRKNLGKSRRLIYETR